MGGFFGLHLLHNSFSGVSAGELLRLWTYLGNSALNCRGHIFDFLFFMMSPVPFLLSLIAGLAERRLEGSK